MLKIDQCRVQFEPLHRCSTSAQVSHQTVYIGAVKFIPLSVGSKIYDSKFSSNFGKKEKKDECLER